MFRGVANSYLAPRVQVQPLHCPEEKRRCPDSIHMEHVSLLEVCEENRWPRLLVGLSLSQSAKWGRGSKEGLLINIYWLDPSLGAGVWPVPQKHRGL